MTQIGPLGLAMPEADGDPIEIVYRMDLDARLWCSGACPATERVDSIVDGTIVDEDIVDSIDFGPVDRGLFAPPTPR
jgi:hypothetical protein